MQATIDEQGLTIDATLVISKVCEQLLQAWILHMQKQILCAFSSSRKGTEETAAFLLSSGCSRGYVGSTTQRAALASAAGQLENKPLAQAVQAGIAFHHGNLSAQDRGIVEGLFLDRAIAVSLEPSWAPMSACV